MRTLNVAGTAFTWDSARSRRPSVAKAAAKRLNGSDWHTRGTVRRHWGCM